MLVVLKGFSYFYPFFNASMPLCTHGALVHAKLSNTWHAATGKGHHIVGCTLGTSLSRVSIVYTYMYSTMTFGFSCVKRTCTCITLNNYDVC